MKNEIKEKKRYYTQTRKHERDHKGPCKELPK